MQYRHMTEKKIPVYPLGFGVMRMPVLDQDNSIIDEKRALEMLNYAYDQGVNYYDTAYNYHGQTSEGLVKKFLEDKTRGDILIADKMPVWLADEYLDYEILFKEQLERLGTHYIDFYLAHSLTEKTFTKIKDLNIFKFFDEKRKSKEILNIGFSYHASPDLFPEVVDAYDWDFCQIQLNYLDTDYQAGLTGLEYARKKGLAVIVMEPLRGGSLVNLPQECLDMIESKSDMDPAQMALRWVLDQDVDLILSGMSTIEQVAENINTTSLYNDVKLSEEEMEAVSFTKNFLEARQQVGCTSCEYCMPCPFGVNICGVFERWNDSFVFDDPAKYRESYKFLIEGESDAGQCTQCGVCVPLCPQGIEIPDQLALADDFLREE